jgi:hypothetical protein
LTDTRGLFRRANDTVINDTPSARATSRMPTLPPDDEVSMEIKITLKTQPNPDRRPAAGPHFT